MVSPSASGGLTPEALGERSRDWSLGHAGDEGPHLAMTAILVRLKVTHSKAFWLADVVGMYMEDIKPNKIGRIFMD